MKSLRDEYKEESKFLKFLYLTVLGRILLKIFTSPIISKIIGLYMDSSISKIGIKIFIKKNNINMSDYEERKYKSFNDFFTRKIKEEKRHVDINKDAFISPCDSKLLVYKIDKNTVFNIKKSKYTVAELIRDDVLSQDYMDGYCLIFRLCVDNYHRYCYVDDGYKSDNIKIKGKLHTVRPISSEYYKVFSQNSREYTVINTENFGKVVQIEIGAIGIGRIKNYDGKGKIEKGKEKGMFEYGGSTIVLLVQKNKINICDKIIENSENGIETDVKMGEKIGEKII